MNIRLASIAAALALTVAGPATSAFAQSYNAPAGYPAELAPGGLTGRDSVEVGPFSDITTGSIATRRAYRGVDSSAKGGNAAQQDRLVPQYGNTSGGPAY